MNYRQPRRELQYVAPQDFRFIREHIEWAMKNQGSATWPPQATGYTIVPIGVQQSPPQSMPVSSPFWTPSSQRGR